MGSATAVPLSAGVHSLELGGTEAAQDTYTRRPCHTGRPGLPGWRGKAATGFRYAVNPPHLICPRLVVR
jgi:hypothetical protein